MTDYGTDISTFPDLDPNFTVKSGPAVVAEAVARRLMTPNGGGLFYDESYGFDLRSYLNGALTTKTQSYVSSVVEQQALLDERVVDASANVTLNSATGKLRVDLNIETGDGPFELVLAISAVGIEILQGVK